MLVSHHSSLSWPPLGKRHLPGENVYGDGQAAISFFSEAALILEMKICLKGFNLKPFASG